MSADIEHYGLLAFPDTHLEGERLWARSALSVLKARQASPRTALVADAYEEALAAFTLLVRRMEQCADAYTSAIAACTLLAARLEQDATYAEEPHG